MEIFPTKPRADGRFQKRIHGHLYYFGRNGDRIGALAEYDRVKRDLYAGRKPRVSIPPSELAIRPLCQMFMAEKDAQVAAGDITKEHLADYRTALLRFQRYFGNARLVSDLRPDDFAAYGRHVRTKAGLGVFAFNRERALIVAMFNHALACEWIETPVRLGKGFGKLSAPAKIDRKNRLLKPDDLRTLVRQCKEYRLKAMILLGINGGFGATDCAKLQWEDVDLKAAVIDTIRNKRKTARMIPLWPETVKALKAVKGEIGLYPTTIIRWFSQLADKVKIDRADGVAFGALRHTFATWANEVQDRDATRFIMGHRLKGMDDIYVEQVSRKRLDRVVNHVRSKLALGSNPSRRKTS